MTPAEVLKNPRVLRAMILLRVELERLKKAVAK